MHSVSVQRDGKIVIGGDFTTPGRFVARVGPDGTPDVAFNAAVGATFQEGEFGSGVPSVNAVLVQGDGKVLVGGFFNSPATALARLNADGSADTAFNRNIGAWMSWVTTHPMGRRLPMVGLRLARLTG